MIEHNTPKCCKGHLARCETLLADLDVDTVDYGFLAAVRHFCVAFSDPDGGAWATAILTTDTFFPDGDSAEKVRRTLAVVQEMRTSRRSTFRFSNPFCQGCAAVVTQDERHLLQLVQSARQARRSAMASSAMLLCEGREIDRVMLAADWFADAVGVPRRTQVSA